MGSPPAMAGLLTLVLLLVAPLAATQPIPDVSAESAGGAALAADDECAARPGADGGCGLHALQVRARAQAEHQGQHPLELLEGGDADGKVDARDADLDLHQDDSEANATSLDTRCVPAAGGSAPWCAMLMKFTELFDQNNNPYNIQKALNTYAHFASYQDGIMIGLTRWNYYMMYHSNVQRVLQQYIPQGYFGWHYSKTYTETSQPNSPTVTLVRDGTFTLNLGWKKSIFWNTVVKTLPHHEMFPYSTVDSFDNCHDCPSKLVFTLKKLGHTGNPIQDWKVTKIVLIKLAKQ